MTSPDATPSRLGRGLSSMVSEVSSIKAGAAPTSGGFLRIPLVDIHEPPHGRHPDAALIESVKRVGVLHPVLVARKETGYELLAGARRMQAARAAGLADIPAIIIAPDRAGALDVYLEENLNRADLAEPARIHLRDRWMRETGRDMEQAEERIPEVQWETTGAPRIKSPLIWMAAAGVLSVVSLVLLLVIFTAKPIDKRPVVIPVEFVEQVPAPPPAPPIDLRWMEEFRFPNTTRSVEGDRLRLTLRQPLVENNALTARARLTLNQLAAIAVSSTHDLQISIQAPGSDAGVAAVHLVNEGVDANRLTMKISGDEATTIDIFAQP